MDRLSGLERGELTCVLHVGGGRRRNSYACVSRRGAVRRDDAGASSFNDSPALSDGNTRSPLPWAWFCSRSEAPTGARQTRPAGLDWRSPRCAPNRAVGISAATDAVIDALQGSRLSAYANSHRQLSVLPRSTADLRPTSVGCTDQRIGSTRRKSERADRPRSKRQRGRPVTYCHHWLGRKDRTFVWRIEVRCLTAWLRPIGPPTGTASNTGNAPDDKLPMRRIVEAEPKIGSWIGSSAHGGMDFQL